MQSKNIRSLSYKSDSFFDINENMLKKLFSPFGKIQEINIVKN